MRRPSKFPLISFAAALSLSAPFAMAEERTVCTVTVHAANAKAVGKAAFFRQLPAGQDEFFGLFERALPDGLASACRAAIACDALVISGHSQGDTGCACARPLEGFARVALGGTTRSARVPQ